MGRPLKAAPSRVQCESPETKTVEATRLANTIVEEPQLTALVWKVSETFRRFAKKARKLSRMTSKSGGPVSSEAYNHLFEEQIRELNRTFGDYMQSREELRYYIESTYWRSKYYKHGGHIALKPDIAEREDGQGFPTAS